jgi:hypothetical protein
MEGGGEMKEMMTDVKNIHISMTKGFTSIWSKTYFCHQNQNGKNIRTLLNPITFSEGQETVPVKKFDGRGQSRQ